MSMCKLHSEFYRQQAKLDALLTRRCHTITEGKNGEGATYIKTARGWLHIAHGVRNTAEGLRYVIYLLVTDLKEPWKVIAEPAGFLIAPLLTLTLSAPHLSTRSKSSSVLMPPPTVSGIKISLATRRRISVKIVRPSTLAVIS